MLILTETTDNIQAVLGGSVTANQMQCKSAWRDITTTGYTPGRTLINTNNTTDVNIVGSPGASTQRVVDFINIFNADTVAGTVTIKFDANGTEYILWKGTLQTGESITYQDGLGWKVNTGSYGAIIYNQSVASQGAGFTSDTYITNSNILIPSNALKVGTRFYMIANIVKGGTGTGAPTVYLRFGTNASTADTAICTFTFTAGTAVTDEGVLEVWATFRTVGSGTSAVVQGLARITHRLSVTGLIGTNAVSEPEIATSSGFNSTVANSNIGVSANGGTSANWTISLVQSQLENLA